MNNIDELLEYVRKTNPGMTKEKLIEELGKCHYSAFALVFTMKNSCITSK